MAGLTNPTQLGSPRFDRDTPPNSAGRHYECNRPFTTSIIVFHSSFATDSLKIVPSPPDPPLVVVP
jgi:hypothetical protein